MQTISVVPSTNELGFRSGANSVHTSRTMMLAELTRVLDRVPVVAPRQSYLDAIVEDNLLGKPTHSGAEKTAKRLTELFALDPGCPLFRLLRFYWSEGAEGRPMLAFLLACAPRLAAPRRDPARFGSPARSGGHAGRGRRLAHREVSGPVPAFDSELDGAEPLLLLDAGRLPAGRQGEEAVGPPRHARRRCVSRSCWGIWEGYAASGCWTRPGPGLLDRPPAEVADLAMEASQAGLAPLQGGGDRRRDHLSWPADPGRGEGLPMSRIDPLRKNYQRICGLPWDRNVAGAQRVWLAVYDKEDERKLRLRLGLFEEATARHRPPLAPPRPDRRLRRLAVQPGERRLRRELLRGARTARRRRAGRLQGDRR